MTHDLVPSLVHTEDPLSRYDRLGCSTFRLLSVDPPGSSWPCTSVMAEYVNPHADKHHDRDCTRIDSALFWLCWPSHLPSQAFFEGQYVVHGLVESGKGEIIAVYSAGTRQYTHAMQYTLRVCDLKKKKASLCSLTTLMSRLKDYT
jgi:hypothetical protein